MFVVLLGKNIIYFKMNYFCVTFQTQEDIVNKRYTKFGPTLWVSELFQERNTLDRNTPDYVTLANRFYSGKV